MALGELRPRATRIGRIGRPLDRARDGRRWLRLVVAAWALTALIPDIALAQCPMCRTALRSPEGQRMVAALRDGIYLLLAAPFAVFGTVAMLAVRRFRSPRDVAHASTTAPPE